MAALRSAPNWEGRARSGRGWDEPGSRAAAVHRRARRRDWEAGRCAASHLGQAGACEKECDEDDGERGACPLAKGPAAARGQRGRGGRGREKRGAGGSCGAGGVGRRGAPDGEGGGGSGDAERALGVASEGEGGAAGRETREGRVCGEERRGLSRVGRAAERGEGGRRGDGARCECAPCEEAARGAEGRGGEGADGEERGGGDEHLLSVGERGATAVGTRGCPASPARPTNAAVVRRGTTGREGAPLERCRE